MSGRALVWAFRIVPRLPFSFVTWLGRRGADLMCLLNGSSVRRMRANHERVLGRKISRRELRDAVRSHINAYVEQLSFGGSIGEKLRARVDLSQAEEFLRLAGEGPVVLALPHAGTFDRVGAAVCAQGISVLTVAEKLNPPELFDAFLKLRTDVGMEIIGVSPGDSVFHSLLEQAKGRKNLVIPLLADRDISGTGIEVEFGTKPALVAAGPAALARALNAPLIAGVVSDVDASGTPEFVRLEVTENLYDPQVKDDDVPELTQKWVTALLPILQRRIREWHMMQAVFVEDLDPERLARARKRAAQKGE